MDALKILRRSRAVFPLAVLAATAMLFTIEGSYWQSVGALDHLAAQREARFRMLELNKHILDADNGQRGYLLTGREEYLLPYQASVEPISELLKTLHAHYGNDTDAHAKGDYPRPRDEDRTGELTHAVNKGHPVAVMVEQKSERCMCGGRQSHGRPRDQQRGGRRRLPLTFSGGR